MEVFMPKYLLHGSYTPEGLKGLISEGGANRRMAAERALQSVGGSLESFYFSTGGNDFYAIVNLPDKVTSTTVSFIGSVSGSFSVETIALLTPEEVDETFKKSVSTRTPEH
jgi:uncharacterized protein with GYD domain